MVYQNTHSSQKIFIYSTQQNIHVNNYIQIINNGRLKKYMAQFVKYVTIFIHQNESVVVALKVDSNLLIGYLKKKNISSFGSSLFRERTTAN